MQETGEDEALRQDRPEFDQQVRAIDLPEGFWEAAMQMRADAVGPVVGLAS